MKVRQHSRFFVWVGHETTSIVMRRSCHSWILEICVKVWNCRRTWNIFVVCFSIVPAKLINSRAPSRNKKVAWLE